MAQQVKVIVAKPEELSSIPGTLMLEGDDLHTLSSNLHLYPNT